MSTEKRTLSDFANTDDGEVETEPRWTPREDVGTGGRCECGGSVSADIARVYGDERGIVPGCADCVSQRGGNDVTNDACAIAMVLSGEVGRK